MHGKNSGFEKLLKTGDVQKIPSTNSSARTSKPASKISLILICACDHVLHIDFSSMCNEAAPNRGLTKYGGRNPGGSASTSF